MMMTMMTTISISERKMELAAPQMSAISTFSSGCGDAWLRQRGVRGQFHFLKTKVETIGCTAQVRSGQDRSGQDRSGLVKSGQVMSGHIKSGQVLCTSLENADNGAQSSPHPGSCGGLSSRTPMLIAWHSLTAPFIAHSIDTTTALKTDGSRIAATANNQASEQSIPHRPGSKVLRDGDNV